MLASLGRASRTGRLSGTADTRLARWPHERGGGGADSAHRRARPPRPRRRPEARRRRAASTCCTSRDRPSCPGCGPRGASPATSTCWCDRATCPGWSRRSSRSASSSAPTSPPAPSSPTPPTGGTTTGAGSTCTSAGRASTVDAEQAFDVLARGARPTPIAHRDCPVPDRTAQRLILVLHSARSGGTSGRRPRLDRGGAGRAGRGTRARRRARRRGRARRRHRRARAAPRRTRPTPCGATSPRAAAGSTSGAPAWPRRRPRGPRPGC